MNTWPVIVQSLAILRVQSVKFSNQYKVVARRNIFYKFLPIGLVYWGARIEDMLLV